MPPDTEFIQPKRATQTGTSPTSTTALGPDLLAPQPDTADQTIRPDVEVLPAASPLVSDHAKSPTPVPPAGSGVWKLKDIGLWPDVRAGGMYRRNVRILIQNANGPCSLLALANCLLLRGSIHITSKEKSIDYDKLSLLIADFLVTRPNTTSSLTLESALSILPSMTQGLDVDVAFNGIDKFKGISARESGELSVFDFAGVELVHGWLADQGNEEEYEALMRAGSYEGAQELIVAGLEAETKAVGLSDHDENSNKESLSEEDQQAISDSRHLQSFLQNSSSQLTYPGLFALSALEPGTVVAFFRNSHLSVLYRRYDPLPDSDSDPNSNSVERDAPILFQLVTDSAFRKEDEITWESIVDVDNSGSGFYNSEFRPAGAVGGDFAGLDAEHVLMNDRRRRHEEQLGMGMGDVGVDDSADRQLAAALQDEEDGNAARAHGEEERRRRVRMDPGKERRARPDDKEKEGKKKDKKDCVIM